MIWQMPVFFDAEIQRKIIYQCFGTGEKVTVNELANLVKKPLDLLVKSILRITNQMIPRRN